MSSNESLYLPPTECTKELQEKAQKLAAFPITALNSGNAIVMYNMLVLNSILTQQAAEPITNLSNILSIAGTIASLNASLRSI